MPQELAIIIPLWELLLKSSKINADEIVSVVKGNLIDAKFDFECSSMVIGVSGGIDSIVLLEILTILGVKCIVAHVDHGMRANSSSDANFVEREAKLRRYKFESERFDVCQIASQKKQSVEEAARSVRYSFFEKIANRYGCQFIALGHHEDDQAETVIMNLIRGSGITGLSGMKSIRDGKYLRPMLCFSKKIICEYALKHKLHYREDDTNADERFFRNRIRHQLLPVLQMYNPKIKETLRRTAILLRTDDDYIEEVVAESLEKIISIENEECVCIDVRCISDYHLTIQRRVVRDALKKVAFDYPGDFYLIQEIIGLLSKENTSVRHLRKRLRVQRWQEKLYLSVAEFRPLFLKISTKREGEWDVGCGILQLRQEIICSSEFLQSTQFMSRRVAVFDSNTLCDSVIVRSVRPGDKFFPLGLNGNKKLSDFLIDEKYPAILRGGVIVVESNGEIIWVVGMRTGEYCKVVKQTKSAVIMNFL